MENESLVEVTLKGDKIGIFYNDKELQLHHGDLVVVETPSGNTVGTVYYVGDRNKLKDSDTKLKKILRKASEKDVQRMAEIRSIEADAFSCCKKKIQEHTLKMKLVDVEMQFDKSKLTFYFTAPQRVDFRALVKELAGIYCTRIELKQIGVRDETKRFGGYGICGQRLCCNAFLNEFEQITTQMAKNQQLSLNPSKISGLCGRLFCCLRYEEETYKEEVDQFPPSGSSIRLNDKNATVLSINIFSHTALVALEGGNYAHATAEELQKGYTNDYTPDTPAEKHR
jgi:cell fate regulator YaaT (PSP1 superfamily)